MQLHDLEICFRTILSIKNYFGWFSPSSQCWSVILLLWLNFSAANKSSLCLTEADDLFETTVMGYRLSQKILDGHFNWCQGYWWSSSGVPKHYTLLTCSLETHGNWFFDQTVLSMVGTAGGPRGCLDLKNKKMQWWRALKVPPLGSNFQLRMMKDLIKRDLGTWNKETMNISFILRSTAGQDIISSRENYKAIIIWWFLKIEQRFHILR